MGVQCSELGMVPQIFSGSRTTEEEESSFCRQAWALRRVMQRQRQALEGLGSIEVGQQQTRPA